VWIGGKKVGKTPYKDARFPSGQVEIRVSKGHHKAASRAVTILDEKTTTADFDLDVNFGALRVVSSPPGAAIFFGKTDTGKRTPHIFEQLSPGVRSIGLKRAGYLDDFAKLRIVVGSRLDHELPLQPKLGQLVVTATDLDGQPCRGEVRVDGKIVGMTPYKAMVQVGERQVVAACGGEQVTEKLTIAHNKTHRLEASMAASKARARRIQAEKDAEEAKVKAAKKRKSEASAAARRAAWAKVFADYPKPYPKWRFMVNSTVIFFTPSMEELRLSFDGGQEQLRLTRLPFDVPFRGGVEYWGHHFGVSVETGGLTPWTKGSFVGEYDDSLLTSHEHWDNDAQCWCKSDHRSIKLGDGITSFSPVVTFRCRIFKEYHRFTIDLRVAPHFFFIDIEDADVEFRWSDEAGDAQMSRSLFEHNSTMRLYELDLGFSYQPHSALILKPAVRMLKGSVSVANTLEPIGELPADLADAGTEAETLRSSVAYTVDDLAIGGRVLVPVGWEDVKVVFEGWYFQGPYQGDLGDVSEYRHGGGRVFLQVY
jgi:hypothetical protein